MAQSLTEIHIGPRSRLVACSPHRIQRTLQSGRRRARRADRQRSASNRLLDVQRPCGRERPRSSAPQARAPRLRSLQQVGRLLSGL